jgi:hypothetical protein
MTDPDQTAPAVFVSYTHDSDGHKNRVGELATRLRAEGVDCELDQWIVSPPEGWPKWMLKNVMTSKFVIVVCTELYFRRVTGLDEGSGLGSKWEGALITQELYDAGGANTKFIPVIFDPADEKCRPPFLRGATYYDVSGPTGYDRLYRHITEQPARVKPPLGRLRHLPDEDISARAPAVEKHVPVPARELSSLVLIFPLADDLGPITAASTRIELGTRLVIEIAPDDPKSSSTLNALRIRNGVQVGVAFGLTPVFGRIDEVTQSYSSGSEQWRVVVIPSTEHVQSVFGEMSFSGHSADDIAEMRARRLLLNEHPREATGGTVDEWNGGMLEVLIRGVNAPLTIKNSPFPGLFRGLKEDPDYFVAASRLFGILFLYLSSTVDRVFRLDLTLENATSLLVSFEGQRPRRYMNVEPPTIEIKGSCDLTAVDSEP